MLRLMATYTEFAERLGVALCTGGCGLDAADHQPGFWDQTGRFHWYERAMRRTSIRNFIWKLSATQHGEGPAWYRYWCRIHWAQQALRLLHLRLPAIAWDTQRATLRALLATPDRQDYEPVLQFSIETHRKTAARWARRPLVGSDPDL